MGQGGSEHAHFPRSHGQRGSGHALHGWPPGGTFLFPSPIAITRMRLVWILHPQRIQRTKVCVWIMRNFFLNYPETPTNCWSYLNNCCACVHGRFRWIQLSETPWAVAHQAPLSVRILQARILQRVAMPSSRRSLQPRDQTRASDVSCMGTQVLYH